MIDIDEILNENIEKNIHKENGILVATKYKNGNTELYHTNGNSKSILTKNKMIIRDSENTSKYEFNIEEDS